MRLRDLLTWYPGVVYICCNQQMDFEELPRAAYVCMSCGATR